MLSCLFIAALWSPAGKEMASCLLFVMLDCVSVTFPCDILGQVGTWFYRFLTFAAFLTYCKTLITLHYYSHLALGQDLPDDPTGRIAEGKKSILSDIVHQRKVRDTANTMLHRVNEAKLAQPGR